MTLPSAASSAAIQLVLQRLASGSPPSREEVSDAFRRIMQGEGDPHALGALLMGLRVQGESPEVLVGIVEAMREMMHEVALPSTMTAVDTCGTGGGTVRTLNISTAAAFVVAGAGIPVAKHGNRSYTSRSGSADVLEALGIGTDTGPDAARQVLEEAGIVFLFAPTFHPAMRHLAATRQALGIPTVMNLVGPLANPARVRRQVVGLADRSLGPLVAAALRGLGCENGMVVHGAIGLDEISPVGLTHAWQVGTGDITYRVIDPAEFDLAARDLGGTEGGGPEENAAAIERLFDAPSLAPFALRSAVVLNAAAAILVSGAVDQFDHAVASAIRSLDEGAAADRLAALRKAAPSRTSG